MIKQSTNIILMIEPVAFGFNAETSVNNHFQQNDNSPAAKIHELALAEFLAMVELLQSKGIKVLSIKDSTVPHTPDSIFPNNWVSFHEGGRVAVYPMFARNRRLERRNDILQIVEKECTKKFKVTDYSHFEEKARFLEGTGSMILDRVSKIAYACLSERTDKALFLQFCADFGYSAVSFTANQTVGDKRMPIYHTNVMMCVADRYVVVCLDAIDNVAEQKSVMASIIGSGKELIEINEKQMQHFAGNVLQLVNQDGIAFLVMSQSAFDSLERSKCEKLASFNELIVVPVPTIEKYGGGSVRCMMAEVF